MIDVHVVNKKKAKKIHRFLCARYRKKKNKESTQVLTILKKKMIDVHVVNKKKQRKYIDSYNTGEKND